MCQSRLTSRLLLPVYIGGLTIALFFLSPYLLNRQDLQGIYKLYHRIVSNRSTHLKIDNASTSLENSDGLTVVTAYFNLGSFQKGGPGSAFTPSLYQRWMTIFASIENPLIAFIESEEDFQFFVHIRSKLPQNLTKVIKINRNDTWAFGLKSRIAEIFNSSGYPRHHPNTVVPEYSAAMHAKYDIVQRAIRENPFHTKYFAWLDIGYFRDLISTDSLKNQSYFSSKRFSLVLPLNFSYDSVAYMKIYERNSKLSPKAIVYDNAVSLGGGYFVGEGSVLYRWTEEYKNATEMMMSYNLISTDQQVIYYMLNSLNPKTKIQTYSGDGRFNPWFHLGYISRKVS